MVSNNSYKKNSTGIQTSLRQKFCGHVVQNVKRKHNACQTKLWKKLSSVEKDLAAREQLIMHYAYLVNWVVSRMPLSSLRGLDKEDLVGYGTIGLIEAVDRFDANRNSSFESFAIARIRGAILDQLRGADHLSRGSRKKVKNLVQVTRMLEQKFGRYPTDTEIATELSISLAELREVQKQAQISIFSLDEVRGSSDDGSTVTETISSNNTDVLTDLQERELKGLLAKAIDGLPEREKAVIGMYHYKNLTFKEIAEVMSFSESRASQLHARAISLLKSKMLKD